jgi:hypothetical protein
MGNVNKDFRDDVAEKMVNDAIGKLKKGAGQPLPRGTDHTKPGLDYDPPPPSTIGRVSAWPKKIHIKLPS